MARVTSASGDSALLARLHGGEPARTSALRAAAPGRYGALLIGIHCREAAWKPMKRLSTGGSDPAPLLRTHGCKTTGRPVE
ncbi:MAG: hypothetical protein ACREE6_16835 [Limisphaerales bacterium]